MKRLVWLACLAACGSPPPPVVAVAPPPPVVIAPAPPPPPTPHELTVGPLVVTTSHARTAQVFHIVDALSAWSPLRPHPQYAGWAKKELPLDDAERAMLTRHAKMRARRRGTATEQAFYVDAPIADAVRDAVAKKLVSRRDAEDERMLLEHFAPRLDPLLDGQRTALEAFEARVAAELPKTAHRAAELARFCDAAGPIAVPVFFVAAPSPVKGGAARLEGGRLVVEIAPGGDDLGTFFHALFHVLLVPRRGGIAIAAGKCDEPVDDETLEEGIAYAFAPGLVPSRSGADRDVLLDMVDEDRSRSLRVPEVRFERLGLALRTELGSALEGGHETLSSFLPRACDAWAKVAHASP